MIPPEERRAFAQAARDAAIIAWGRIADLRHTTMEIRHKPGGPASPADTLAEEVIYGILRQKYPPEDFGYLGEESIADSTSRRERSLIWIIDPIDGTKSFLEGRPDFAMQIGLAESEAPGAPAKLIAAAVYLPAHGQMFTAALGAGAYYEAEIRGQDEPRWWEGLTPDRRTPDRANFGTPERMHTRSEALLSNCAAVTAPSWNTPKLALVKEHVPLQRWYHRGSLGVKLCEIAMGRADIFINTDGSVANEWDLAAPHLILTESGGTITDLLGGEISYNRPDTPLTNGIIATNGACHETLLAALQGLPHFY